MRALRERLTNRIFKPRRDGSEPIALTPKRIYILPSRVGLLYASLILVMLVASINYNLALGYVLMFQMFGLGFASMVQTAGNLWGLTLTSGDAPPVFAGETAYFPFFVQNTKKRPRPALRMQARDNPVQLLDVDAHARASINLPVHTIQRGYMHLPRITFSTPYPLGIFLAWCYPAPSHRCLVYPAPEAWPLPETVGEADDGATAGEAGEEDFAGLRERLAAEPLRHVAWKAAARDDGTRPLLVKHFEGGASASLWLDWSHTACFPAGSHTEQRLSILTGWVLKLDQAGCRYGLLLPGKRLPPGCGDKHRERCLEALALHERV